MFSLKVSLLYLLFSGPEVLSSASDKAELFAKNFSKKSNLYDLGIFLPVFLSGTNLKLHNISIPHKMVKKVITNLDSSNVSGPDCIPVVALKNCGPELSIILAELFNVCLKETCCWEFLLEGLIGGHAGEHVGPLHKFKFYGISGQIFGLYYSFFSNRPLLVVVNEKSPQE